MKRLLLLTIIGICISGLVQAQTLEELQSQKADLEAKLAVAQGEADGFAGEIAGLEDQIKKLSGWITGLGGTVGFGFNKSNGWIANPNPDASSSSLNIGLTAFANQDKDKSLWYNKALITKSWVDVNTSAIPDSVGLFKQSTVDIVNLSSLYGYKITKSLALSGLGELNTSIENFLSPGTLDIGAGVTYTGVPNLVVVVHPLNYHIGFGADGIDTQGALGAKIRADYGRDLMISGKKITWSSTLTSFIPYSDSKNDSGDVVDLFEYTWLNSLAFEVWKGIGVGISFGLRDADFEDLDESQNFYSLGLSYGF